jgi:hypothetical protein
MWQTIDSAPTNGDEVLLYRDDAGVFIGRWTAPIDFLSDSELEKSDLSEDAANEYGWFYADFMHGDRLDEPPTHWMRLPAPPEN